jgi:hydrogenase expression/formation protein HypD
MKYVDEFRQGDVCQRLIREIHRTATRRWTLMEVCGGQTHGLLRYGIDTALEGVVRLIHGPGCPVCVTPAAAIDLAIELARRPGITVASFGDMLRVPGSRESLLQARAEGGRVRIVYSPLDAVQFAHEHRDHQVVFFAVGFETTAPATALAVHQAGKLALENFSLLVSHVRVQPAMELLAASRDSSVQGFLGAGHVCTVAGYDSYHSFVDKYQLPVVVTGFEPVDLLSGILECVRLLEAGEAKVVNCYGRSAAAPGNVRALEIMDDVYEICDRQWRGLGVIPGGGYRLRPKWARFDAEQRFDTCKGVRHLFVNNGLATDQSPDDKKVPDPLPSECRSGEVLTGRIRPTECEFFGGRCTPESPLGAPMVSAEGACAAYFRYSSSRNGAAR